MRKKTKKIQSVSLFKRITTFPILLLAISLIIFLIYYTTNIVQAPQKSEMEELGTCNNSQQKYCFEKGFTGGCSGYSANKDKIVCKYGPEQTQCLQPEKDKCSGAGHGCKIIGGRATCIYNSKQTTCTPGDANSCKTWGFGECKIGPNQVRQCMYTGNQCSSEDTQRCQQIGFTGCTVQNHKRVCTGGMPKQCDLTSQQLCRTIGKPNCSYDNTGNTVCTVIPISPTTL